MVKSRTNHSVLQYLSYSFGFVGTVLYLLFFYFVFTLHLHTHVVSSTYEDGWVIMFGIFALFGLGWLALLFACILILIDRRGNKRSYNYADKLVFSLFITLWLAFFIVSYFLGILQ